MDGTHYGTHDGTHEKARTEMVLECIFQDKKITRKQSKRSSLKDKLTVTKILEQLYRWVWLTIGWLLIDFHGMTKKAESVVAPRFLQGGMTERPKRRTMGDGALTMAEGAWAKRPKMAHDTINR